MLNRIIKAVKMDLPKFNNDVIIDLRKREFDNLIAFIAERFSECAFFTDPNLILEDYQVLSPHERLIEELTSGIKKNIVNIRDNEAVFVKYNFRFYDRTFSVFLYVPYIFENSTVVVNGTNYECLLSMTEKLFSVRALSNGVTIKVIRSPISCQQNTLFPFTDAVSGEQFIGRIVSCKIHYKKTPKSKKIKPTIIHYLLCKFTIPEVLEKFEATPDAARFVELEPYEDGYYYFKIKGGTTNKEQIFLKVDKTQMQANRMLHDVVSAILYLMSGPRLSSYQELINDSKTIFKILLGKLIFSSSTDRIRALSYMIKHIESTDTYLDNYTRSIFIANGIVVNDIYDLLCFVAKNIAQIVASFPNNNMFNKRLETINHIITDNLVRFLYNRIYNIEKKPDHEHLIKSAIRTFKVPPHFVLKNLGSSDSVRFKPSINGDNWLLVIGNKVVKRLSASVRAKRDQKSSHGGSGINAPVNRFHPSMMVVESPIGFSSKPGTNCLINPYANVDATGGFIRDEFAEYTTRMVRDMANDNVLSNPKEIMDDVPSE